MKANKLVLIVAPILLLVVAGLAWANLGSSQALPTVVVYKSPTCGCCGKWVSHLEQSGFTVETHEMNDLSAVKSRHGVQPGYSSCHTAVVDGYVVEGHVPADQIKRLLDERPEVAGLAVPGMPIGSPGMEGPNPTAYDVLAFSADGETSVFAHVTP